MATIFQDTFTDDDSTNLTSHTPDVDNGDTTWSDSGGPDYVINSNATETQFSGVIVATIDLSAADFVTTIDVYLGETAIAGDQLVRAGFVFRYSDSSNYWLASIVNEQAGATDVEIWKYESASWSLVTSSNASIARETMYTMTITTDGTSIEVTANSVTVSTTNSFNQSATNIGLFSNHNDNSSPTIHDNLLVDDGVVSSKVFTHAFVDVYGNNQSARVLTRGR